MDPTAVALLDGTWFAAEMSPSVRRSLSALARIVDYDEGVAVVRPGAPASALGVIADGRVALRLAVPGVGQRTIQTLEDGDIFGWSAVLGASNATSLAVTV